MIDAVSTYLRSHGVRADDEGSGWSGRFIVEQAQDQRDKFIMTLELKRVGR